MMERIVEQTLLYDFYGELLTAHQRAVYEDVVLNAKRDFDDLDERMTYKIERLHAANDLSAYLKAVSDQDFSKCIYIDGNSELLKEERILTGIKEVCNYKHPDWMDKELKAVSGLCDGHCAAL